MTATVNGSLMDGRRILIIEDEHIVAESLRRDACARGVPSRRTGGHGGAGARKLLDSLAPIDGALLDIDLRGVRAYSVADR